MFDDKIGRILGTGQVNVGLRQPENRFGEMKCNINTTDLINKIKSVLDRMPEVKKASGTIRIDLADGKQTTINLNYRDY